MEYVNVLFWENLKKQTEIFTFAVTMLSFSLILILFVGELCNYFTNEEIEYRFSVDAEFEE